MKTLDDFIAFYESVPENKWCTGNYYEWQTDRRCAVGHILHMEGAEFALSDLIVGQRVSILGLNDGRNPRYQQPHPKLRVLAFLNDLKAERLTNDSK
jgi:hypothetical protein